MTMHDCCCDEPHATPSECREYKREIARMSPSELRANFPRESMPYLRTIDEQDEYVLRVRDYDGDKLLRHLAMAREVMYDDDYRRAALEVELEYRLSL